MIAPYVVINGEEFKIKSISYFDGEVSYISFYDKTGKENLSLQTAFYDSCKKEWEIDQQKVNVEIPKENVYA